MRAEQILRRICGACLPGIHRARADAVVAAVEGLVHSGRLSVTGVGRGVVARTSPKHCIKRVDRLLSNPHLYAERQVIFAALSRRLLVGAQQAVILVDWTKTVPGFHALVAAIPVGGRALPIYFEVHPERLLGNRAVQQRFLRRLRDIVPPHLCGVVIADAGFQGPFIRQVVLAGWHYVVRVRGTTTMRNASSGEVTKRALLCSKATNVIQDLGAYVLYVTGKNASTQPQPTRLVLGRRPQHTQHRWWRKPRSGVQRGAIQAAKEPWVLATSLHETTAAAIVRLYATRMQIEETFRDAKNHRFGWSFRYTWSSSEKRITLLLLLSCLAMLAVTFVGLAAEAQGFCRRYQANTVKRRVLSYFVLGSAVVRRGECEQLRSVIRIGWRHVVAYCSGVLDVPAT